jgi:hypothetical protein
MTVLIWLQLMPAGMYLIAPAVLLVLTVFNRLF